MEIRNLGIAAAAAVMVAGFSAAPANAEGVWVAIAGSPSTDAWGWAYADTAQQATDLALGYCSQDGATDCAWQARSRRCIALARSNNGIAGGVGATLREAEQDALHDRGGGWIVSSHCASRPSQRID